jgi:predicted sulfurtransferase
MSQETEQKLKDLCALAIDAREDFEADLILGAFRTALQDHLQEAKALLASQTYLNLTKHEPQSAPPPPAQPKP